MKLYEAIQLPPLQDLHWEHIRRARTKLKVKAVTRLSYYSLVQAVFNLALAPPTQNTSVRGEVDKPTVVAAKEAEVKVDRPDLPPWIQENVEVHESRGPCDCPIVALADLLQMPYGPAKVLAFHHGWTSTKGIDNGWTAQIMEERGHLVVYRPDLSKGLVRDFKEPGTFIVTVHGHVMSALTGVVNNQQGTGDRPILEVYEVFPVGSR